MLLLTEPFGFDTGDSVSFRSRGPVDAAALTEILLGYSCYPPAIPKIIACLDHSGRYDCTLQSAWFRQKHLDLACELGELGISIEVTHIHDRGGAYAKAPFWPRGRKQDTEYMRIVSEAVKRLAAAEG